MRFTLLNLLIANAVIAFGLAMVLSDEEKIRRNAELQRLEMMYIARSEAWRRPPLIPANGLRVGRELPVLMSE